MNRRFCALSGLGLLIWGGSTAAAPLETWQFNSTTFSAAAKTDCGGTVNCRLEYTLTSGAKIAVHAYSTSGANTALTTSSTLGTANGTFIAAELTNQNGSGLGIKNATSDQFEGDTPEHAADNEGRYDLFVFEALSGNPNKFDWESIGIGWAQEFTRNTDNTVNNLGAKADIQFFVGNKGNVSGGTDFTTMCFSGCGASTSITDSSSGFKAFAHLDDRVAGSVTVPGTGTETKGRYMVVSGALNLGGSSALFDAFKLNSVSGYVPEPHSLALLGLGAFAMFGFGRQRRRA